MLLAYSTTSTSEVLFWCLTLVLVGVGIVATIFNWDSIKEYYAKRRNERARLFGYKHRLARLEYDPSSFGTTAERDAYHRGWDERGKEEKELKADEFGSITPDTESSDLGREIEALNKPEPKHISGGAKKAPPFNPNIERADYILDAQKLISTMYPQEVEACLKAPSVESGPKATNKAKQKKRNLLQESLSDDGSDIKVEVCESCASQFSDTKQSFSYSSTGWKRK